MATKEISFAQAIREALEEEMRLDPTVFMIGQDIRLGLWGVSGGMHQEFGEDRVLLAPISENGFCGAAVGAALAGYRPVVEVMYDDFLLLAADAICNQAAKYRYMCGGGPWKVPLVYRMAGTGTGGGSGLHHSQSLEATIMHYPGLKVIFPASPADAKGLLKSAIRDDNPVVMFEHKLLYGVSGPVPEGEYTVPIGKANIIREGRDATVITYGIGCSRAIQAAEILAGEGVGVEVLDLRTLLPLDKEAIVAAVKKTGRLVILEFDSKTMGAGAEIAAIVAEEAIQYLDGPVKRLAMHDTCIPGHRDTEELVMPSLEDLINAVRQLV